MVSRSSWLNVDRVPGRFPGVDLLALDRGPQRLGMDPELLGDPLDRTGRGRRVRQASTGILVARSRSSSGYFFGGAHPSVRIIQA
ncbi:hypothetical protein GCM10022267_89210 [Lentzea roselyniae]|uniref:Uncharacterized protein n=1 Tax=Lentzea roselyniae TaxID=531940 RepID=A0ABP7CH68_9PSEU